MKRAVSVLSICLLAASVHAMRVYVPLPCLVAGSDLIVVGTVDGDGKRGERELLQPGMSKPITRWYHDTEIAVEEVLLDPSGTVKAGQSVPVVSWAKKPEPPPQPRGDGLVMLAPVMADGPSFPNLRGGQKYLLVLRRLPKEDGFLLPSDTTYFIPVEDRNKERLDALREAADTDRWSWGKESNGLRLALAPDGKEVRRLKRRQGRNGPWSHYTRFTFVGALRNVSDEPIAVNHYAHDHYLVLASKQGDEGLRHLDLYEDARLREEPFGPKCVSVLQPGHILLLARYGVGTYGDHIDLDVEPGEVRIAVKYESSRDGAADGGLPLWKGTVTSSPVTINVVEPAR